MAETKRKREDAPWWNPFAPRTLWCQDNIEAGGHVHVCERQLHADDRPHLCSCGMTWTG